MKKTNKAVAVLLASTMAMGVLAGCGSSKPAETTAAAAQAGAATEKATEAAKEAPKSGEKTQVVIWSDARHDLELVTQKVEEFNASNDHIEVVYDVYTDNYSQALQLALDTGKGPDIFTVGQDGRKIGEAGAAMNLLEFLSEEELEYFGTDIEIGRSTVDPTQIISLPWSSSFVRLVYNKDIFKAAGLVDANGEALVPATYADVVEYAKVITEQLSDQGIYGFGMNLKSAGSALNRSLRPITIINEGVWDGYDLVNHKYNFDAYKDGVKFFKQMYDDGSMIPGVDQLDIDPMRAEFAMGHIGMYMSYSHAEPGVYSSQFPTEADWDFALLPAKETAGEYLCRQYDAGGPRFMISTEAKDKEATWEVYQWLYGEDMLKSQYEAGLSIAAVTKIAESCTPEAIAKRPLTAKNTATDSSLPDSGLVAGIAVEGEDYNSVFAGHILGVPGYEDLDALCADLNERYNAALKRGLEDGTVTAWVLKDVDLSDPAAAERIPLTVDMLAE